MGNGDNTELELVSLKIKSKTTEEFCSNVYFRKIPLNGSTDRMGTVIWVRCGKCQINLRRDGFKIF